MPNELTTKFVLSCLGILVVLCGFFGGTVLNDLKQVIKGLTESVKGLAEVVNMLRTENAVAKARMDRLEKDLAEITGNIECPRANCLYQGPRLPSAVNHG